MSTVVEPGSAEWLSLITPSKVAAIIGVSRWESPYRLWHRMKGLVPPEPPADRFDVGHAMEMALAELWRIKNPGWQLSRPQLQIRRDLAEFSTLATLDRRARRGSRRRVVEFKIARKLEDWGSFGTDQAPADYVAQLQWQMHVTGYTDDPAHLMVMGPYFAHHTYEIGYDPELATAIEQRCAAFHQSLRANQPPPLDDSVPTYECVRELHPDLDPEVNVELDPQLAADYLAADRAHKAAETTLRGAKIRVLAAMGTAAVATSAGLAVATRRRSGKSVALYADTKTPIDQLRELTPA
ncbi:YqaJ viral recombinase family protein [Nocardia sp. CDC159]|uniref:YqaJ viral recombinase family protein n=1 Tax=Nocardia pulmonis TaxID=2951408 RepID=A0A9X2IZH7_9NOCA|nr:MULTISPECIES: YqaJ viral recombinase family protein [Nocardia]MCM6774941.1 YqaJ viral recombinase family protein [Nocardia pulmonis]MCM6789872.1 YqaJ viral recombinase family protein [Nocardia sp. CDC159]